MASPRPPAVVAVIPDHPVLDAEAAAAITAGLPVVRFIFRDELTLTTVDAAAQELIAAAKDAGPQVTAIHRGFMLSSPRYAQLAELFSTSHRIHLRVHPEQYTAAHYYPTAYPAVAAISPRCCWCPVPDPKSVTSAAFAELASQVQSWGAVVLKDYVKSAKPLFLDVDTSDKQAFQQACADFVAERGVHFTAGVVAKERVALSRPRAEWRLWFIRGVLHSADFNSDDEGASPHRHQPSEDAVAAATEAASRIPSPYITIDLARTEGGRWVCIEVGDGGVSGPAVQHDLPAMWAALQSSCSREP